MLKYNMLTSHKQGNRIANKAQLSELRSENMYQEGLKRVWKMVCFIPNWNQEEHPSLRFPRTRNVASLQRIVYVLGMFYFNLCERTCCYTLSVPYAICRSHLPVNISVSRRLNGLMASWIYANLYCFIDFFKGFMYCKVDFCCSMTKWGGFVLLIVLIISLRHCLVSRGCSGCARNIIWKKNFLQNWCRLKVARNFFILRQTGDIGDCHFFPVSAFFCVLLFTAWFRKSTRY